MAGTLRDPSKRIACYCACLNSYPGRSLQIAAGPSIQTCSWRFAHCFSSDFTEGNPLQVLACFDSKEPNSGLSLLELSEVINSCLRVNLFGQVQAAFNFIEEVAIEQA